jgi:hypothetical protein
MRTARTPTPLVTANRAPLRVLLLCHFRNDTAGTILDHINAFRKHSPNEYRVLSNMGDLPPWLDLSRFDALIIHYSLVACYDYYISPEARRQIREFKGFKAAFVQDDYRWINDTVDALALMRINALFSLAGQKIIDLVYSPERLPCVRKETVLAGYVSEALTRQPVPPLAARPIDVGYRARKLPAWMGSHVLQKWQIAERFGADARRYGLRVDLSCREEDRIYGHAWIRFMANCKAVLGTESGASVCDFTGEIQRNVEAHIARDPYTDFDTLRKLYFEKEDGRILMNVISPRCLEAAALRTLMIMYEGEYSGILKASRHYVPLARDHSNMLEVVKVLRDPAESQRIVDRAYEEVALNEAYSFCALVDLVDRVMAEGFREEMRAARAGYSTEEFAWRTGDARYDVSSYVKVSAPAESAVEGDLTDLLVARRGKPGVLFKQLNGSPHVIDISCPIPLRLHRVHLHWAEPRAAVAEGEVVLMKRADTVATIRFGTSAPTHYQQVELPGDLPKADLVRLILRRNHGGSEMRLMDLRIESLSTPMRKSFGRIRRGLGKLIILHMSDAWMALPLSVRARLRRYARGAFELVFGRF